MNKKDRFDAFMKLAEFRRQYRESRRATEWRVTLAAWALLVGMATILKSTPNEPKCVVIAMVLVVIILHIAWVRANFKNNEQDAEKMWDNYEEAMRSLSLKVYKHKSPTAWYRHFVSLAGIIVTLFLGLLVYVVNQLPPSPSNVSCTQSGDTRLQQTK